MEIIGKRLNRAEFSKYVDEKNFGTLPANKLVIHHTWSPTESAWKGKETLYGIKRYYEGKGWNAGPHLFVAADGIWLFTDMRRNGIHAGELNTRSIGIEVVGNYDDHLWTGETKLNALHAIKALQSKLNIPHLKVHFHRDVSTKSCPGWAIKKEWLYKQLDLYSLTNQSMAEEIKPPSNWAKGAWEWSKKNKIVSEKSDPHALVPKEEVAVMIYNAFSSITE